MGGFFDEYQEIGGNYMSAEEKQVLIDNGIPFQVKEVLDDDGNKWGARFAVKVLVPDPESGSEEERVITFGKGSVESRDRMLIQMQQYLARDDAEPVSVILELVGRSQILRSA